MAEPLPVSLDDYTEDWTKHTFDFWRDDGTQMDTLDEIADSMSVSRFDAARMIATYPFADAVPVALIKEAYDELGR